MLFLWGERFGEGLLVGQPLCFVFGLDRAAVVVGGGDLAELRGCGEGVSGQRGVVETEVRGQVGCGDGGDQAEVGLDAVGPRVAVGGCFAAGAQSGTLGIPGQPGFFRSAGEGQQDGANGIRDRYSCSIGSSGRARGSESASARTSSTTVGGTPACRA